MSLAKPSRFDLRFVRVGRVVYPPKQAVKRRHQEQIHPIQTPTTPPISAKTKLSITRVTCLQARNSE